MGFGAKIGGLVLAAALAVQTAPTALAATAGYALAPTSPGKWGNARHGTGARVTWSLMPTGTRGREFGRITALADFMPRHFEREIAAAFDLWSDAADLRFRKVKDNGRPFGHRKAKKGDIRMGGIRYDGRGGTVALAFFPPRNGGTKAGNVFFDIKEEWSTGGGGGVDLFSVAVHELGHALGLDHFPDPSSVMHHRITGRISDLAPGDVAGIQALYGPPQGGTAIAGSGVRGVDAARAGAEVAPVPLPGALPLALAGFGFLALLGRRRGA